LLRENWTKKGENFTTVHLLEGNYGLKLELQEAEFIDVTADSARVHGVKD
jgi:hypothetical protein